jgi:NAD(P)-dependent dehydrogenase (short-subunit alcohol dehydrogenase family)
MSGRNRSILVTGAARGIGEACVARLAGAGFHVFAGVRSDEDAERLGSVHGEAVSPLRLDVTSATEIEAATTQVADRVGEAGLYGLVNNAGIAVGGPLEFLPLADFRRQLDVNVTGQVAVTQAMLPLIRRARASAVPKAGRIVFIGSISGLGALPFTGAYAASKHALEAIADALRAELRPWGIEVVIIEPGAIATPIWNTSLKSATESLSSVSDSMNEYYGHLLGGLRRRVERAGRGLNGLPPDTVARVVQRALVYDRPRTRYLIGRDAWLRLLLERLLPDRMLDALVSRQLDRLAGAGKSGSTE